MRLVPCALESIFDDFRVHADISFTLAGSISMFIALTIAGSWVLLSLGLVASSLAMFLLFRRAIFCLLSSFT